MTKPFSFFLFITASLFAITGCETVGEPIEKVKVEKAQTESERINVAFEEAFMTQVMRSPITQSYLGIKQDYDKWDDLSEAFAAETLAITRQQLKDMRDNYNYELLDHQAQISYRLAEKDALEAIEGNKYRHHNYPVNQMFGLQSQVPAFLINIHQIADKKDAESYIARVAKVDELFSQLITQLKIREKKGILAPRFVYPHVLRDIDNMVSSLPLAEGDSHPLVDDFTKKIASLNLEAADSKALTLKLIAALNNDFRKGFLNLQSEIQRLQKLANDDDGAWKFPDGEAFYNFALKRTTTTDLDANTIHEIGVAEVDRIHDEMRIIMKKVGFSGDLNDFFVELRENPKFYYENTEAGKNAYLNEAEAIINTMKGELDSLFIVKPKADLIVKAVEPFREKSAGKAFYQRPAPDGSRPGTYYANLYDMSEMPIYQMEALAYHEGIPGHHMQLAIAQELEGIPKFRKFGGYTAYTEGWGLYSEYLPKEYGYYQDPYSDFGRLAMELWRACRLVVDTGIHAKKWTRQEAIDYLVKNTPNPEGDSIKAIERYIVMPSQATAYKIGMLKILELRERAKTELGPHFDIREFHDVVLKSGALTLAILEEEVEKYIASKHSIT